MIIQHLKYRERNYLVIKKMNRLRCVQEAWQYIDTCLQLRKMLLQKRNGHGGVAN